MQIIWNDAAYGFNVDALEFFGLIMFMFVVVALRYLWGISG